MTSKLFLPIIALISLLALVNKKHESENKPLHIVELYTSQGCSSCPAADEVLSELKHRDDVLTLAFHVSYWDRLGWKDPYSSKSYDSRQRKYGKHFGLDGVYTPQVVVDGETELVGTKKSKIDALLNKILLPSVEISISQKELDGKLFLTYALKGDYKDQKLYYGILENNINTKVKAGENNGKSLKNDGVVRYFSEENLEINPIGELEINIEALEINKSNATIFVFVQNQDDLKILGAMKEKVKVE
jgi:hypothetical protein